MGDWNRLQLEALTKQDWETWARCEVARVRSNANTAILETDTNSKKEITKLKKLIEDLENRIANLEMDTMT